MTNVERQKRKYLKRVYSQCLNVCNHENEGRFKTSLLERLSILKRNKNLFFILYLRKEPYTFINVAKSKVVDEKENIDLLF